MSIKAVFLLFLAVDYTHSYWTEWTEWSSCSRSCENGLQFRTRRCIEGSCGSNITKEIRICNSQKACDYGKTLRGIQCETFNGNIQYGKQKNWKPYFDSGNLCALTCKSEDNLVAVLSEKVEDGTPCPEGSNDVCIDGICKSVGCDGIVDSKAEFDECGVCDGNGSSCRSSKRYKWVPVLNGVCSATCGRGLVKIQFVCEDTMSRAEVDDFYCSSDVKPVDTSIICNQKPCPQEYRWITEQWGNCSVMCGYGVRHRVVLCSDSIEGNPAREENCLGPRPRSNELCIMKNCSSSYKLGDWSQCSVTCGEGTRSREVICTDHHGKVSRSCNPDDAPSTVEICSASHSCSNVPPFKAESLTLASDFLTPGNTKLNGNEEASHDARFIPGPWAPCSVTCGEGIRSREVNCQFYLSASKKYIKVLESECTGERPATSEPCFMSPCSMSRLMSPFYSNVETNDVLESYDSSEYEYDSDEVEPPILLENLLDRQSSDVTIYEWKTLGYSECSASCLGGVHHLLYSCVKLPNNITVNEELCGEEKPPGVYHICNSRPCPPRWKTSNYSLCSVTCGSGIQKRNVTCIQDIAEGISVEVPEEKCPSPAPSRSQSCNMEECQPEWRVGNWSNCQKSRRKCIRKRQVTCAFYMDLNVWKSASTSLCKPPRPVTSETCLRSDCRTKRKSLKNEVVIEGNRKDYVFHQKPSKKMVLLTIGGTAEVYKGTWLTIKCPTRGFSRSKVKWFQGSSRIKQLERIEVTKSGNLLIYDVSLKDAGIYWCKAGQSSEKINLVVKGKFNKRKKKQVPFQMFGIHGHYNDVPRALMSSSHTIDRPLEEQMRMVVTDTSLKPNLEEKMKNLLLKKGHIHNFHFEWLVTPWSNCSQICGPQAFQFRGVDCLVRSRNITSEITVDVNHSLCELAGLKPTPASRQQCGLEKCPQWRTGFWSRCEESKCFALHTAIQVREVNCVTEEGDVTDDRNCKAEEKPMERRKCKSKFCEGVWKSEDWSECQGRCGEKGIRTRLVLCVWKTDNILADNIICDSQSQPPDFQECTRETCSREEECSDRSTFCQLVPLIHMCDKEIYKRKCCFSCSQRIMEIPEK
ncbi:ADAMTS-like protein 3 [Artemia franciscana]|uniref:Uncharacterized protein n=1 Tax=Artemia franciscana TaxID=6661 RepID=A0AA88I154_ARTSF|nr:hypothetical protein QYM36_006150 [Artemia franciscana]